MSALTGTWSELIYANTSPGLTQASFTTEQPFNTAATMGLQASLPAGFFLSNQTMVGNGIKILARGILASTATPTYTFTCRGGSANSIAGPIIAGSGAISTISGATTSVWEFEADVFVKTAGAGPPGTGNTTLFGFGKVASNGLLGTANCSVWGGGSSPGTLTSFDPTITNYINFNIACSASSASNTITLEQLLIFGLN
jgi:hypothetical protein